MWNPQKLPIVVNKILCMTNVGHHFSISHITKGLPRGWFHQLKNHHVLWLMWARSFFVPPSSSVRPSQKRHQHDKCCETIERTCWLETTEIHLCRSGIMSWCHNSAKWHAKWQYGDGSQPYPPGEHQNSWDLWMFIPLKMVCIGIDP